MNKILFILIFMFSFCFTLGYLSHESKSQEPDLSLTVSIPRDIYLRGEINETMAFKIGAEINALNTLGQEEITLHITSPGGEVYAGLQIYDYMTESKAPIRTSCEGYCMSMAAYLLASGKVRQSDPHATIMFHQVGTQIEGKINQIIMELSESQRLQSELNDILSKRSGLTVSQLDIIENHDNYMSPEEAKTLNLIDTVVGK